MIPGFPPNPLLIKQFLVIQLQAWDLSHYSYILGFFKWKKKKKKKEGMI